MINVLNKLFGKSAGDPHDPGEGATRYIQGRWQDNNLAYMAAVLEQHADEDGVHLLVDGVNAFAARLALIKLASTSIDVQYYLFHSDLTGKMLAIALLNAADKGVRVRLLIDDIDLSGREYVLRMMDMHPNVEIRIFNPFSRLFSRTLQLLSRFGFMTRRMHNKSLTIDSLMTIVGGRNIGDEYFSANPLVEFGDLDALVVGPIVNEVSASFNEYWNNKLASPVAALHPREPTPRELDEEIARLEAFLDDSRHASYVQKVGASDFLKQLISGTLEFDWVRVRVLVDSAEKLSEPVGPEQYSLLDDVGDNMDRAARELIVMSPYFVPGRAGVDFFAELVERGVRVRILTNSLASNDVPIVHCGYSKYRRALVRAGVEVYEFDSHQPIAIRRLNGRSRASLHAKVFVMDRQTVFVGSLNLDPRSVMENTEIGILFDSELYGQGIAEGFEDLIRDRAFRVDLVKGQSRSTLKWSIRSSDGAVRMFEHEPYTGYFQRMLIRLISFLPIESKL
jgi:putative cardiolipin synthase